MTLLKLIKFFFFSSHLKILAQTNRSSRRDEGENLVVFEMKIRYIRVKQ